VGQDEIDVVRLADTTVVVLVPGMGDDVQAIKAGLLEIADIFLINKADKEGVNDLERGLRHMLSLVPHEARQPWEPPIHRAVATRNEGLRTLVQAIQQHQRFLVGPVGERRRFLRQR
jgi:LAO/AO transport system kinase